MCMCVTSHQPVECVQIMSELSSNLRQWPLGNLGSVAYCYVFFLSCPALSYRQLISLWGCQPPPAPTLPPHMYVLPPHRIIRPLGNHLSPSQHTYAPCFAPILFYSCSLFLTLPHSCHAYQILVASAPLPLPKLLLPWPSADFPLPLAYNTATRVSPLPHNPYI